MDKDKVFTVDEADAIILIADALAGERIHPESVDFSSRSLAHASGAHPHLLEGLLDWLGCFRRWGYRRATEDLRAVIAEHLPAARLQHAAHLERLQTGTVYAPGPEPHADAIGTVKLGDWTFTA